MCLARLLVGLSKTDHSKLRNKSYQTPSVACVEVDPVQIRFSRYYRSQRSYTKTGHLISYCSLTFARRMIRPSRGSVARPAMSWCTTQIDEDCGCLPHLTLVFKLQPVHAIVIVATSNCALSLLYSFEVPSAIISTLNSREGGGCRNGPRQAITYSKIIPGACNKRVSLPPAPLSLPLSLPPSLTHSYMSRRCCMPTVPRLFFCMALNARRC